MDKFTPNSIIQTIFIYRNLFLNLDKVCLLSSTENLSSIRPYKKFFLLRSLRHRGEKFNIKSSKINFNSKVVAIAIATLTLPFFAPKTSAYNSISLTTAPDSLAQAQIQQQAIDFVPRRQPPIDLVIEIGVGLLLLMGLIAAYFANRTQKFSLITTGDAKDDKQLNAFKERPTTASAILSPRSETQLLPKATRTVQEENISEHAELVKEITLRLQQSFDLEDLYKTAVKEIRRAIKADRVLIYALDAENNWQGTVIAESVAPQYPQTLRVKIDDPCFRDRHIKLYQDGRVRAIANIDQEPGLTDCHRKLLAQFAIKANVVVPILYNEQLFGLLIAHQCDRPRSWQLADINLLSQVATQVGFLIKQVAFLEQQQAAAERAQLIQEVTLRLQRTFDLQDLAKTAVKEMRRAIRCDRVIVYQFDSTTLQGNVIAESVAADLPQTLRVKIDDPCFREHHVEMYKNGRVRAINNIYQEPDLAECHIKLLAQFAVKANLVAPLLHNDQLFGLAIAHQCDAPRIWQPSEIELFSDIAKQISFAIDQVSLRQEQ